jgi:hypothetical protein
MIVSARTRIGIVRRTVLYLCIAGVLLELACCWLWIISPELTATYNAEFTRQMLERLEIPSVHLEQPMVQLETGLIAMSVAYVAGLLVLVRASWNGRLAALVVGFSLLFHVTFLAMPGMYSTDIFSYVMYGRIASVYANNPYTTPPSSFGADPFLSWVFPFWQNTPTVYGPLWTEITALLSNATSNASALDQVLAYKLLIWTSALINLVLVWTLTQRAAWLRGPRLACFALYAWNPIILFELAGNAHNDALMITLLLLSVIPLTARPLREYHWLIAAITVTASALIKFVTAPVAVFYVAAGLHQWRSALLAGAAVFGLITVVSWPYHLSAPNLDRPLVINSISEIGVPIAAARIFFVAVFAWDLVRVWRLRTPAAVLEASARALLLLPLLVLTWVWSWYFAWSIAIAAVLGIQTRLAQTIIAFSVIAPPVFYAHQYLNQDMPPWPLLLYFIVPPLVLLRGGTGYRMLPVREGVGV